MRDSVKDHTEVLVDTSHCIHHIHNIHSDEIFTKVPGVLQLKKWELLHWFFDERLLWGRAESNHWNSPWQSSRWGLQEELHISLSLTWRDQVALEFSLWIIKHCSLRTPQTALAVVNIKSRFAILFSRQIFSGRLMCGWLYGQILKGKQHNGTESHFTDFWRISFSHSYPSLVVSPDQTTESWNGCWLTHDNR